MSISRQSPLPPPQSPLIALGEEKLNTQLDLEEKLRLTSEELLEVYKSSRQWKQVSQIAQTLSSNSERITCIQDCLSSLNVFELPPPTPPSSSSTATELQSRSDPALEKMVEDPEDEFISVKRLSDGDSCSNNENSPLWEIRSKQHTRGETVVRTPKDVSLLLVRICKSTSGKGSLLKEGSDMESPSALREILVNNLEDSSNSDDPSLLQCFLSPKINNFSSLVADIESEEQTKKIKQVSTDDPHSCTQNENEPTLHDVASPDIQSQPSAQNGHESEMKDEPESNIISTGNATDQKPDGTSESDTENEPGSQNENQPSTITSNDPETIEQGKENTDNRTTNEEKVEGPESDTNEPTSQSTSTAQLTTKEEDNVQSVPSPQLTTEEENGGGTAVQDEKSLSEESNFDRPDENTEAVDNRKDEAAVAVKGDIESSQEEKPSEQLPAVPEEEEEGGVLESLPKVGGVEVVGTMDDVDPKSSEVPVHLPIVQSPSKNGLQITNASQLFIKSAANNDPSPPPLFSDTDTPTDLLSSSEGILIRSGDYHASDESNSSTSGRKTKGEESEDTDAGKSTFFLNSAHSMQVTKKREDSPKEVRRGKSHSMFYNSTKSESPPPDQENKSKFSTKLKRSFKRTNKIKREASMEGTVSLIAPQLATNWDPTCILEELYSDCHHVLPQSSSGESCRYAGYLDKLPVNQSKPAVMKGWKHRYFRVTRGSLFYYDDEKTQKAISFVRLTDARIILHQESLKVEINEKNGNFIFLRAETRDDVTALHRALQLESVHPTLAHRLSLSPVRSTPTIIIDLGSCSVRAGLLSDDNYPQLFFPNVCAFNNDSLVACGSDSLLPSTRGESRLVYPRRHRLRMDSTVSVRDCFTAIVEDICKRLDIKPEKCNVITSVSPIMPESEQQILAEVVLETLGFQGLLIQEQTTLALYSYNCTTGISVNVGDSISIVPIIDGYKVEGADQHIPLGGGNVTESLSKLASSKDIRYFSDTEMYIVRHIKESICFLSQDYLGDAENCDHSPHEYTRAVDVDRFQLPDHKKVIALDLALFKAPEGLFQPGLWGKDVAGIHEMVQQAIEQCPIDLKREMCRHIYLSGGTSLLAGFPERLKMELSKLFPRSEIAVHADENRYHAAYVGASILASLNSFQESLVTQDDWISDGFDAFKKSDK